MSSLTKEEASSRVSELFTKEAPAKVLSRKHLVGTINTIFIFEIHPSLVQDSLYHWTIDLTEKNVGVYPGKPKLNEDAAPVTTFQLREDDLIDLLLTKKLSPAQAFMTGKLKVMGSQKSLFKFHQFWHEQESVEQSPRKSVTHEMVVNDGEAEINKDGLKSDVVFAFLKSRLAVEVELTKKIRFVIQVNILKAGREVATWTIDTKTSGEQVYRAPPSGVNKPDATLTVDDEDYVGIMFDRLNAQRAFLNGRLKVKGNIMLLQRLKTLLTQLKTTRCDPERVFFEAALLDSKPFIAGLASESVAFVLIPRLVRLPKLLPASTRVRLLVTDKGERKTSWLIGYNEHGHLAEFKRHLVEGHSILAPKVDLQLELEDGLFVQLTQRARIERNNLDTAICDGLVKVKGNRELVPALQRLFQYDANLVAKL